MKKEEIVLLMSLVIIVLINGIIGYFGMFGILFTPVVIFFTTYTIYKEGEKINIILISLFAYLLIALNDVLIKIFGGGTHDNTGLGFILVFTLMGLIPSFVYFIFTIYKRNGKMEYKIIAVLLFVVLIICHYKIFSKLGLDSPN
jgi:hypothetical protein